MVGKLTGSQNPAERQVPVGPVADPIPEPSGPNFTKMEVAEAALLRNNLVSAATRKAWTRGKDIATHGPLEDEPGYKPFDDLEAIKGYPPHLFTYTNSSRERERAKTEYDEEQYHLKALDSAPVLGTVASIGSAVLDPTYMIPVMGWGTRAVSASSRMVRSAGAGAGVELIAEAGFQTLQETRTMEESLLNVGVGALMGGLVGRISKSSMTPEEFATAKAGLLDEVKDIDLEVRDPARRNSMYSTSHDYDVKEIAKNKNAVHADILDNLIEHTDAPLDDLVRTADTIVEDILDKGSELRDVYPLLGKTTADIGEVDMGGVLSKYRRPVERQLAEDAPERLNAGMRALAYMSPIRLLGSASATVRSLATGLGEQSVRGTSQHAVETAVKRYEAGVSRGLNAVGKAWKSHKLNGGQLSNEKFGNQVLDNIRFGNSTDEAVISASRSISKEVFEPLLKKAVDAGVISPEDAKNMFGEGYVPRFYNHGALRQNQGQFIQDVTDHLVEQGIKRGEATQDAYGILDSIRGANKTFTKGGKVVYKSKHGKKRSVEIPDSVLVPYMNNNVDYILNHYSKALGAEIEIVQRYGSLGLEKQIKQVHDEYDQLVKGKTPKETRKLNDRRASDIKTVEALRDRLINRHGVPDDPSAFWHRAGNAATHVNVLAQLGGMTVNAISDIARPIWAHGFKPYGKALYTLASNPQLFKMAREDMLRFHSGLETTLDHRARSFAGSDYNPHSNSMVEKGIEGLSMGGGPGGRWGYDKLTGMAQWNAGLKSLSGIMSADEFLRKVDNPTQFKRDLRLLGVDEQMAGRISEEFKKHGNTDNLRFAKAHLWDDPEAAIAFETAIIKQTDQIVVTPGILDSPLATGTTTGKILLQYQSFAFGAHNKMLLAGIANPDINVFMGLMSSISMGMLVAQTKRALKGDDPIEDPWELLGEGIMVSGVTGMGSTLFDRVASPILKNDEARGVVADIMGPTGGTLERAWTFGINGTHSMIDNGQMTDHQALAGKRLIPYNNLFYLDKWLNGLVTE